MNRNRQNVSIFASGMILIILGIGLLVFFIYSTYSAYRFFSALGGGFGPVGWDALIYPFISVALIVSGILLVARARRKM